MCRKAAGIRVIRAITPGSTDPAGFDMVEPRAVVAQEWQAFCMSCAQLFKSYHKIAADICDSSAALVHDPETIGDLPDAPGLAAVNG